jgi:hypothetical protein
MSDILFVFPESLKFARDSQATLSGCNVGRSNVHVGGS